MARPLPDAITRYFGLPAASHRPVVVQEFTPGRGWDDADGQRPSGKRLAGLRRRGVTAIGVSVGDRRIVDFQMREL